MVIKDYTKSDLEYGINEYIVGKNAERDRIILRYKLIDGLSYVQIADRLANDETLSKEYKIEVRQLQRVVSKAEKQLFKHI